MQEAPKEKFTLPRIPRGFFETVLDALCILCLLGAWGFTIYISARAPVMIPSRQMGERIVLTGVDRLYDLPALATAIFGLMGCLRPAVGLIRVWERKPENKDDIQRTLATLFAFVKFILVAGFCYVALNRALFALGVVGWFGWKAVLAACGVCAVVALTLLSRIRSLLEERARRAEIADDPEDDGGADGEAEEASEPDAGESEDASAPEQE